MERKVENKSRARSRACSLRNDGNGMTNFEFISHIERLKIHNFRGYIMRDEVTKLKPLDKECGALNLDNSENEGTHTVCWFKDGDYCSSSNAKLGHRQCEQLASLNSD